MIDREKVIKGLEATEIMLKQAVDRGGEMAVMGAFKCYNHVSDALAMLKEQEAVEPKEIVNEHFPIGDYRRTKGWACGSCGEVLHGVYNYCSYCGTAVKWE